MRSWDRSKPGTSWTTQPSVIMSDGALTHHGSSLEATIADMDLFTFHFVHATFSHLNK